MYAVLFGLLRFVRYHHYSIFMSVYCIATYNYKLFDCWEKKSSFNRNRVRFGGVEGGRGIISQLVKCFHAI